MGLPKPLYDFPVLNEWCILSGYRGSVAHGMYTPKSIDDKDTMHICVLPRDYYWGLGSYLNKGTKEIAWDEWDIVVYEVRKFFRLLQQGNPNVLSLLWLEENYYIDRTYYGEAIIENRNLFVSKRVFNSFAGYARGQQKRMTRIADNTAYMSAKRRELYEKHGYDCKNAAHMIRLLRMGIEFLVSGELNVLRKDAKELLQIKNGEWTLEQVETEAHRLFDKIENAYINSRLPNKPDEYGINNLLVQVVGGTLRQRGEL